MSPWTQEHGRGEDAGAQLRAATGAQVERTQDYGRGYERPCLGPAIRPRREKSVSSLAAVAQVPCWGWTHHPSNFPLVLVLIVLQVGAAQTDTLSPLIASNTCINLS